jgi:hypothetical protein
MAGCDAYPFSGEAGNSAPAGAGELAERLEDAITEVNSVLEELREIARGLHPATLPRRVSRWLRADVPSKAERRFGLPVTTIITER